MIRRDSSSAGRPPEWLLISQVAHAKLAGQLARAWDWTGKLTGPALDEFLEAIDHHDDGWDDWDRSPRIDSQHGRPLSFTELPAVEATSIWKGSIAAATRIGPLATYMVAGHFHALLERYDRWRGEGAEQLAAAEEFLAVSSDEMAVAAAQASPGEPLGSPLGRQACLHWLQFFDAVSLWLCMAERQSQQSFASPEGPEATFTPAGPSEMIVTPWPLVGQSLCLAAPALAIPATPIAAARLDLAASGRSERFEWRMIPQRRG